MAVLERQLRQKFEDNTTKITVKHEIYNEQYLTTVAWKIGPMPGTGWQLSDHVACTGSDPEESYAQAIKKAYIKLAELKYSRYREKNFVEHASVRRHSEDTETFAVVFKLHGGGSIKLEIANLNPLQQQMMLNDMKTVVNKYLI